MKQTSLFDRTPTPIPVEPDELAAPLAGPIGALFAAQDRILKRARSIRTRLESSPATPACEHRRVYHESRDLAFCRACGAAVQTIAQMNPRRVRR